MNEGQRRRNNTEPEIYSSTTPEAVTLTSDFVFPFCEPSVSNFFTRSMLSLVTSPEVEKSVEERPCMKKRRTEDDMVSI
jgi:hypothetical protein